MFLEWCHKELEEKRDNSGKRVTQSSRVAQLMAGMCKEDTSGLNWNRSKPGKEIEIGRDDNRYDIICFLMHVCMC